MADTQPVKALFPIGKTQWAKWNNDQRTAFNEARAEGISFPDAVAAANQTQPAKKKKNVFDIIEDVAEAAADVASIATSVAPVVAVAKTVVKSSKKGK